MNAAVCRQRPLVVMEFAQGRSVADRDDRGCRQPLMQQPVKGLFTGLIERCGGLVEEQPLRRVQEGAGDAEPLLLAERQHAVPVRLFG